MLNTFNIIWGPLEIFYGTPNLKKTQKIAFFALFGGSNSLLKMKILDVVTLGDDSDSLIPRITPKLFFSFTPMARGLEGSKIIV